ncbi:hypothetical protein HYW32_00875 [Candidatus Berkelbacteria bacterium]|nr:hypothetical protein [Candidatus Berkelbacteria bacterium]
MFKRFWSVLAPITLVVAIAVLTVGPNNVTTLFEIDTARAGDITSPTWTLSDTTASATNVTYTHTFTTETAIPINTGGAEIWLSVQPGMEPPQFTSSTLASGSTEGFAGQEINFWSEGKGGMSISIHNKGTTAIPAGEITLKFSGVTNPSRGGALRTNTYTKDSFTPLDGRQGPDSNGVIAIGTQNVQGTVTEASTSAPVANFPLEIHGENGFWQATTATNGTYGFYGVPAGNYMLEMSYAMDPNSSNASSISQYLRFEQIQVTVPASGTVTQNISLQKSSKVITGVVKYSDTGAVVANANVNAFSNGPGGFASSPTNSSGEFTLRVGGGNYYINVMPNFFGGPGGPGNQSQTGNDFFPRAPRQVSFVQAASVAETIAMGDVLVDRADATVTGKLEKPNGSGVNMGGMGAMNFRTHTMIPIMVQQDGNFSFKAKSGTGTWELNYFDPGASVAMPPDTQFKIDPGANNLGTIKMVALDKTITVNAKRIDGGKNEGIANMPVMTFQIKRPGPPFMSFTDSTGTAQIKVPAGFEGRVMGIPGGKGGPGKREGGEGDGEEFGWLQMFNIAAAYAQEGPGGGSAGGFDQETSRLFPVTAPQRAKAGDTVTLNFDLADKSVTVRTVDKNNNAVSEGAFVNARPLGSGFTGKGGGFGGSTSGGSGTIYTTKGDFTFNTFFPPDSNYMGIAKTVTVGDNGATADLLAATKTVTVTGEVRDASNNNAVVKDGSLGIMIGLFGESGFSDGKYNPADGTYTAKFVPDTKFRIGVAAGDPGMVQEGGYIPNISPVELEGNDGETLTQHVTLAKVDAKIKGTVKDQNGTAIKGVTITADPGLAELIGEGPGGPGPGPEEEGIDFGFSDVTEDDGSYEIDVAANKYSMIVNARKEGLFVTQNVTVDIKARETKENINLSLQKADAKATVEVNNKDSNDLGGAEVQIFNDEGTINFSSTAGSDGKVTIDLPAGTYNIKAGKDSPEDNGKVEGSAIQKVIIDKNETESMVFKTETDTGVLPAPVVQEISSSSPSTVSLSKGGDEKIALNIPAGALSSSSSSSDESSDSSSSSSDPLLSVTPLDKELVPTKALEPIVGMSVDATDSSGNAITSLSGQVSGSIKYDANKLPTGVKEDNLEVRSFNEDSGIWEPVISSAVDKASDKVTFSTNHFTDFAIVAATDTTAPSAPTNVAAADLGTSGKVALTWTNPSDSDFNHINIYRSTTSGTVGSKIGSTTASSTTRYEDSSLTNGTKYYYVARSVDATGNESANTTQVSATPSATTLPLTGPVETSNNGLLMVVAAFLAALAGVGAGIAHKQYASA